MSRNKAESAGRSRDAVGQSLTYRARAIIYGKADERERSSPFARLTIYQRRGGSQYLAFASTFYLSALP